MQLPDLSQKPPGYVLASILCSLGGFLFGVDTGIIGPVTVMEDFTKYVGNPSPTIHGLIVSSILIPAAISSFFAGRVADALGRPRGIAIGSFIFGVGAALEGASMHIAMFIVGRIIEGIGEGLYLSMLVVYICEISPPRNRGALTTGPQLLITLGLVTGFFTCYGTADIGSSFSWRLPFILLAGYSLVFSTAALIWLPASPRWLTLHGKTSEASAAWEKLGVPAADREKILDQYDTTVVEAAIPDASGDTSAGHVTSTTVATPKSKKAKILDVFSSDARPRLFLAVFLMTMQQLSGIDGVLYYAPLLFQQAGLSSASSTFLASGVSALVIFAVTIPATLLADRWSRRTNTILGGLAMSLTMFLMGTLYASHTVHPSAGAARWVVIVCIYLFAVIYCVSWAVGIKIYAAEIQPQRTRAAATSLAHGGNWLSNFLVALVTPTLLARSSYGAYFLFGGCALITAVACWVWMPETRGLSLGEIEDAFARGRGWGRGSGIREFVRTLRKGGMHRSVVMPAAVEA
ncbi:general substrate transporter [Hypoxylon trugodes]|uniref:general substrate transporter n=1 Tax=Hypoxylon trugodes TaxID=326681 RepID=UPI00219C11DE|nr:general substrate transporter [Hypoxylon trugodes]KAI1385889.1 general substrate transporter [Hypoxylon trugodes]